VSIRLFFSNKAASALMVGAAFFLAGCQQKIPPVIDAETMVRPHQFVLAERYVRQGELNEALEAYQTYLRDEPTGASAGPALQRMAKIYLELKQYENALKALERVSDEHPDYPRMPEVRYQIADALFRLGKYKRSTDEAMKWLERYPNHTLEKEVLILLGDNFRALENNKAAFYWWLKAKHQSSNDPQRETRLDEKLNDTISNSPIETLDLIAEYAAGTAYAPKVYHRMASIYLEQNRPERAKEAATFLVEQGMAEEWILTGRELLERIDGEMAVRRGVVGCLLPLSGPFAIYGEEVLNGVELGMGLSEDRGKEPGLEIVIRDTKGTPEGGIAALKDLVMNENVIALIGPLSSRTAIAVAKMAQNLGVPMIAMTQRDGIVEEGDMVFRNFLTPSHEIERLLEVAVGDMGLKRFGILYPENAYGRFCMKLFWDKLEDMNGTVTAVESYGIDDTDFADQIRRMVGLYYPRPASLMLRPNRKRTREGAKSKTDPEKLEPIIDFEAVFIPDNFQRVAMIAPQLAYYDVLGVQLIGTSPWQSQRLIEMARDYVQGAMFSSGFIENLENPAIKAFVEEYRENYGSPPGLLAASGYDTVRLLKEVLSDGEIQTRGDLKGALFRLQGFEGVTGVIAFDFTGEVTKEPILLTVSGNKIVPFH